MWQRYTLLGAGIALVITTVGYFAVIGSWLQARVDSVVTERYAPYEAITEGLALNQMGDYQPAVDRFLGIDTSKITPRQREMRDDALLYALTFVDDPNRYTPDFERIRARVGPVVPPTAWRKSQLGWYLLRVGRSQDARVLLSEAVRLYDARQEWRQAAEPLQGLFYVALAEGKVDAAVETLREMSHRNPRDMGVPVIKKEAPTWTNEKWFAEYQGFYPHFHIAYREFIARLEAMPDSLTD